jgi:hypothetical protein
LSRLIDSKQHLLTFHPRHGGIDVPSPYRVGWKNASTIPGFCGIHDCTAFAALEQAPFEISHEQCFLLGYRALCHEIFSKRSAASTYSVSRDLVDRGMMPQDQEIAQQLLSGFNQGLLKGLEDLAPVKAELDRALLAHNWGATSVIAIEFDGPLCLASTGTITPDFDLDGNRLQLLHDTSTPIEWLSIAVDVTSTGGAVVFSFLRGANKPRRFLNSLLRRSPEHIVQLLPQILFFYLENTYFSDTWWSGLSPEDQSHLRRLAEEPNPYYSPGTFNSRVTLPWIFNAVHRLGGA